MADKVIVIIADDWEIKGNGLGDVADLMYLPSLFFMNLCDSLGIKMTYMVEVMQQLMFLKHAPAEPRLAIQAQLWEDTIGLMLSRGYDVQYHLHPQWLHARYSNGLFYLSQNWNLATYPKEDRQLIFKETIPYFKEVIGKNKSGHTLCAFKAGAWALMPSKELLAELADLGISLVFGPRIDLRFQRGEFNVDYTHLEEWYRPYYPSQDDVGKISEANERVIIQPITPYTYTTGIKWHRLKQKFRKSERFTERQPMVYHEQIPDKIKTMSPLVETDRLRQKILGTVYAHLNVENNFAENKIAIDQIMRTLSDNDHPFMPFLIETHTKGFPGRYENVAKALTYLVDTYGSQLEFQTCSEYVKTLSEHQSLIKRKHETAHTRY